MSLNTEAQSNEDIYWEYVRKLAIPLGLGSIMTGSATVVARSEDVVGLKTVWESSKLKNKSWWDQGDVLSVEEIEDSSSFKLIWRTAPTFGSWAMTLIEGMYDHGYLLQFGGVGLMHFERKQLSAQSSSNHIVFEPLTN
jgi:hypothetical protein